MSDKPTATQPWELFVVSSSHLDLGWCGDPAECLAYSDFIIETAIDAILGDYSDYRFTVEYALFMEHFLARFPEREPIVRQLTREGKLEVCPTAVGSMEQTLDGELLIRSITEGARYIRETFGITPITAQHTDLPGHAAQMPQILARAGIKYMTGSRFHPSAVLYHRIAPDGSSVVFSNHGHHYNWGYALRKGVEHCLEHLPVQIEEIAARSAVPQLLMAEEHDLDMPAPSIMDVIRDLNSRDLPYKLRSSTVTQFFESIDPNVELPRFSGEAPYGFYTCHAFEPDIYLTSREAENALATAEKLSSMRHLLGLGAYPRMELRSGWRSLFYPLDHNFAGRHGPGNERQRLDKAIHARDTGDSLAHEAGLAITTNIKPRREGFPITLFNPCSWSRDDIVQAKAEFRGLDHNGVVVHDGDGNEIPCQIIATDRARDRYDFQNSDRVQFEFLFVARDVPPLGYKTYYVTPCEQPRDYPTALAVDGSVVSSSTLKLTFGNSGLESIVRLSDGRELVDGSAHAFAEPVVLEDRRGDLEDAIEEQREKELWMDAGYHWKLPKETLTGREWRASESPIEIDVVEAGPVRATIRLRGVLPGVGVSGLQSRNEPSAQVSGLNSRNTSDVSIFEQLYAIYDGLDRIDLVTKIDWQGAKNTLVTLPMRFAIENPEITYESPFAAIRLEEDEFEGSYRGIGGRLVQKWADVSGDGVGVTIATASGSHFLRGSEIVPIVLKSTYSTGDAFHVMSNKGRWEFRHRIVPHGGDWRAAKTYRHGWECWSPMLDAHFHPPLRTVPNSKELPDTWSLLETDANNVVVTTVKQTDRGDGFAMRLFDAEGVPNPKVRLKFSKEPKSIHKANLMEEPESEVKQLADQACLPVGAWEIATLLVE